jgi:head-tail adaptor
MRSNRIDGAIPLNPGLLRSQLTWQRKALATPAQDGFGEDLYDWETILECKGNVRSLFGQELQSAQERWAEARYQIRQHYSRGLQRSDRVLCFTDGAYLYLDVLDIADRDGIGRSQVVTAKEWVK